LVCLTDSYSSLIRVSGLIRGSGVGCDGAALAVLW
jgi:hypothetical protein